MLTYIEKIPAHILLRAMAYYSMVQSEGAAAYSTNYADFQVVIPLHLIPLNTGLIRL